MTTLVPGFYGKLPSHGDFVRRRLTGPFVASWDAWLQDAIARSKDQLGANWLDIYLSSPIWRFVFTPGVCGPDMSAGVLMPSVDKAGRYFPLTMVVNLPEPVNPLPLAAEYDDWFSRAESILLSALDETAHFELEAFDRQIEQCVLDFKSPPKLPAGSESTVFPGHNKSWHIGIASVNHLGASLRHLHWKQLGAHFDPLGMWWTNGSEQVAPSALLCEGIPAADTYAAMLDGHWVARQLPSIRLESVSRLTPSVAETPAAMPVVPIETPPEPVAMPVETPAIPAEAPAIPPETPMIPAEAPAIPSEAPAIPPETPAIPAETPTIPPEAAVIAGPATTVPEVPQVAMQPSQNVPPSQEIIPEFDPMETTAPQAPDGGIGDEPDLQEPAIEPDPQQEALPGHDPVVPSERPVPVPDMPKQVIPDIDPLDAIDLAQSTDTPLDPLEALGLSQSTDDNFGVSNIPNPDTAIGSEPPQAFDPGTDAVRPADPVGQPDSPDDPGAIDYAAQPESTIPAAVQPAVRGSVFLSASATHAGKQSDFNEDAFLERRNAALWAVADGCGGHWIGDVASQAVVSELETVSPSTELGDMADDVKGKLLQAHRYLQENLDRNSDSSGDSGAAVAVFVATETMSACLSAGPVRVYRCRDGSLDRLTPDDGVPARLVGHAGELLLDSRFNPVEEGDWYLVCSRGLYETLDDENIARVMSGAAPDDVCESLMSQALSIGARDNVTVVVVRAAPPDGA